MSKLCFVVFGLAVVAQTLRAQPHGHNFDLFLDGVENEHSHSVEDYSEESTSLEDMLSKELTDEYLEKEVNKILSRKRRGFRSRLRRAWKKHIRPAVQAAVTAQVVKSVVPAIAAAG